MLLNFTLSAVELPVSKFFIEFLLLGGKSLSGVKGMKDAVDFS